jgi:hypothetical protein
MLVKILIAVHKYMLVPAICMLLLNIVNYIFLLLRLCILIVMFVGRDSSEPCEARFTGC